MLREELLDVFFEYAVAELERAVDGQVPAESLGPGIERIGVEERAVRMADKNTKRQRPVLLVNRWDQLIGQIRQKLVSPAMIDPPNRYLGRRHVGSAVGTGDGHDDSLRHITESRHRPDGAGGSQEIGIAIEYVDHRVARRRRFIGSR